MPTVAPPEDFQAQFTEVTTTCPEDRSAKSRKWANFITGALLSLLIAATAVGAYMVTVKMGFLLDDLSHLDYGYRAVHGDYSEILRVFHGNWTGTVDGMVSYRPLISVSYLIDYLLWGMNAAGYHITNILMFACCSVLTGLLTFELSPMYRISSRFAMMLAAALLFIFYPLHPESVAWVVGRVDLQCGLFLLLSTYLYILAMRTGNTRMNAWSLLFFALALPSKEMAVTFPACLVVLEALNPFQTPAKLFDRLRKTSSFWAVLVGFAVLRTIALGTVVGGYGDTNLKSTIHAFGNFANLETWGKIFYGVNEEFPFSQFTRQLGLAAWSGLALVATCRLFESGRYWRTLMFLTTWICIAELPTFQIWHVFPNLSGSRLLFIPSSPLCILIAMLAIPAITKQQRDMPTALRMTPSVLGTMLLITLGATWSSALNHNLAVWRTASAQMDSLRAQIVSLARETPPAKKTLLLDLPSDYAGAGLIGRPEFLNRLLREPFTDSDLHSRIITAERPIAGDHEFTNTAATMTLLNDPTVIRTYTYNRQAGLFEPWTAPEGTNSWSWSCKSQENTSTGSGAAVLYQKPPSERDEDNIQWYPGLNINPLKAGVISIKLKNQPVEEARNILLVWRSTNQPKSWVDYSAGQTAQIVNGKALFEPWTRKAWLLHGTINAIGFKPIGDREFSLDSIQVDDGADSLPKAQVISGCAKPGTFSNSAVWTHLTGAPVRISYDASPISSCRKVRLAVTKCGATFYDFAASTLPKKKACSYLQDVESVKGTIDIPDSAFAQQGMHQFALVGIDEQNSPVSLISPAITIESK